MKKANKDILDKLKKINIEDHMLCVYYREYSNNKTKYCIGTLRHLYGKVVITKSMDIYKPYLYKNYRLTDRIVVNYDNLKYIKLPTKYEKILYKMWKNA
jgi:hypothetical protein